MTRALDHFAGLGVVVQRVMTDNGSAYRSKVFAQLLADRAVTHKRTRPYRPQTNGKVCEDLIVVLHRVGLTPAKV